MTFEEYQKFTDTTRLASSKPALVYTALGLAGESGEVAEKIKKVLRDHGGELNDDTRAAIRKEMGDVLWYLAQLARDCNLSLEEIAELNVQKLQSRWSRNQVHGSGDDR
jgi:NTP pyrophosphatase (non-canonical NTP hydrolase)